MQNDALNKDEKKHIFIKHETAMILDTRGPWNILFRKIMLIPD